MGRIQCVRLMMMEFQHLPAPARRIQRATVVLLGLTGLAVAAAQNPQALSRRAADAAMERWPGGSLSSPGKPWHEESGILLQGMAATWYDTADGRYFQYIKDSIDPLIAPGGDLSSSDPAAYSLDDSLLARQLLLLYRVTLDKRYYQRATVLRLRLAKDPLAGARHELIDDRVWLSEPFLAEY